MQTTLHTRELEMRKIFRILVSITAIWALTIMAEEQEPLDLDELVITPTGTEKEVFDTSLAVSVVTEQQMIDQAVVFIEDIFKNEPGVDSVTAGPGSVHPIIRGLHGERILVLVDGTRLSEERPGGNHIFSLNPSQIAQVEIVRGPSSVLYGSDAIGGVINFITKRSFEEVGEDLRVGGSAKVEYQDNGEGFKETMQFKLGKDNFNTYFGGTYQDTDDIENKNGTVRNSFYDGFTIWTGGNYIGNNWDAHLDYYFMDADIGIPSPDAFDEDFFKGEKQQRLVLDITSYDVTSFMDELSMNFGFQRHNRHRYRTKTTGIPDAVEGEYEIQIWLDIDTYTFKPQAVLSYNEIHTLTYGLDSFYEDATSDRYMRDTASSWVNPVYDGVPVIPDSYRFGIGAYAQDDINLTERFIVTPGLRVDYIKAETDGAAGHEITEKTSNDNHAVSGNLGLLYKINDAVNAYCNIGRAFRAPTLLELYFYGPHDVANDYGNPDLEAETSWNFDTGIKFKTDQFNAIISLFYNTIDDYIVKEKQTDGNYMYKNYSRVELYGGEAGMNYYIGEGLSLFANLSAVTGKNTADDSYLPSIPPLTCSYGCRYDTEIYNNNCWIELTGETAAKQTHLGPNEIETDGYTIGNIRTGIAANNGLSFIFAIENIADTLYEKHTSAIWQGFGISDQAGRNIKLQVQYKF